MPKAHLKLLHLSDIHFKKKEPPIFEDLRTQVEKDAQKLAGKVGEMDGILITGDIAFSGASDEYEIALDWLAKLSAIIGCDAENVWAIPGNHDVERSVVRNNKVIQTIQQDIRAAGAQGLDASLNQYFSSSDACELMYRPIKNYLEFATKFQCQISAAKQYIEHDFELNDGSVLRIRGVNSTLLSYENDSEGDNKLAVGTHQATLIERDGIEYLLMCHHPYPWLIDYDKRKDNWAARAKIHLFGHKHKQRLERVDDYMIISAGAMQPSEQEPDWIPRYNALNITVTGENDKRFLKVEVFPRVWNEQNQMFVPDYFPTGKDSKEFELPIKPWTGKGLEEKLKDKPDFIEIQGPKSEEGQMSELTPATPNDAAEKISPRRLTYRFLRLPYHIRMQIVNKLNLLRDEDKGLPESLLFPRFFRRAAEDQKIPELSEAVETEYQKLTS